MLTIDGQRGRAPIRGIATLSRFVAHHTERETHMLRLMMHGCATLSLKLAVHYGTAVHSAASLVNRCQLSRKLSVVLVFDTTRAPYVVKFN